MTITPKLIKTSIAQGSASAFILKTKCKAKNVKNKSIISS
jgi:hypothetical protein